MTLIHKTYSERAYLTRGGHRRLDQAFVECARLYNAAKEHRVSAWKHSSRKSVSYMDQCRELTVIRAQDGYWGDLSLQVARGVILRLDRAFQGFYRRCKAGQTPGFPRWVQGRRWKTIEIAEPSPAMVKKRHGKLVVRVRGLPILRIRPSRELPDSRHLKALTITRKPTGVWVNMTYAVEREELGETRYSAVGMDLGVSSRIALSDGGFVERRPADDARKIELQRRIARCRKNSGNRRKLRTQLARLNFRQKLINRNECHRITTALIRRYGFIAAEDLPIPNMTKSARGTVEKPGTNVRAKSGLNRSILEQTWGLILGQLEYKADWYGRTLVKVDPKRTSQTCSECGTMNADHRRAKRYDCGVCGLSMDADTNAARNILARGVGTSAPASARTAA